MLCKFVNKMYIKSHDMRKNMVSERGGGADKKKKEENDVLNDVWMQTVLLLAVNQGYKTNVNKVYVTYNIIRSKRFYKLCKGVIR